MFLVSVLIYIKEGKFPQYEKYENIVLSLLENYKGDLCMRLPIPTDSWLSSDINCPHELHILSFPSEDAFHGFLADPVRKQWDRVRIETIEHSIVMTS